jgi:hypothetical protein
MSSLVPRAKLGCPEASRPIVEAHMAKFLIAWRQPPQTGEKFDSLEAFKERMIAWSFYQGFYPQESGGGTLAIPSIRLVY